MTASSDLLVFPQSIADSTRRAAGDPNPKSPVVTSSCAPHLVIPPSPRKHKSRAHSNNNNKQATSSLLIGFVYSVLPNRIVLTHCLGYLPYPEIKASQLPPRNWKKPFAKTTSRRPSCPACPGLCPGSAAHVSSSATRRVWVPGQQINDLPTHQPTISVPMPFKTLGPCVARHFREHCHPWSCQKRATSGQSGPS